MNRSGGQEFGRKERRHRPPCPGLAFPLLALQGSARTAPPAWSAQLSGERIRGLFHSLDGCTGVWATQERSSRRPGKSRLQGGRYSSISTQRGGTAATLFQPKRLHPEWMASLEWRLQKRVPSLLLLPAAHTGGRIPQISTHSSFPSNLNSLVLPSA